MKKTKVLFYPVMEGRSMTPTEHVIVSPTLEDLFVQFEILNYLLRKKDGASFIEYLNPQTEKKAIDWYNELTDNQRNCLYYHGEWNGKKLTFDLKEILNYEKT